MSRHISLRRGLYIFLTRRYPGDVNRNAARQGELITLKTLAAGDGPEEALLRNPHASFTCQLKQLLADLGKRWGAQAEPGRASESQEGQSCSRTAEMRRDAAEGFLFSVC